MGTTSEYERLSTDIYIIGVELGEIDKTIATLKESNDHNPDEKIARLMNRKQKLQELYIRKNMEREKIKGH